MGLSSCQLAIAAAWPDEECRCSFQPVGMMAVGSLAAGSQRTIDPHSTVLSKPLGMAVPAVAARWGSVALGPRRVPPHISNKLELVGIEETRSCRERSVGRARRRRGFVRKGARGASDVGTWYAAHVPTWQLYGSFRRKTAPLGMEPETSLAMGSSGSISAMVSTGSTSNSDSMTAVDNSSAPPKSELTVGHTTEAAQSGGGLNFRGFPTVLVCIANKSGEVLAGQLVEAGTKDINILCHGFRSSMKGFTVSTITASLAEKGLTTFRFDFSGNGLSEGLFEYGNYAKEVEDLRAVVEYWRNQGREVNSIIGHSKGGNVVILYAAKYDDVAKVVNVSGRFNMGRGLTERFGEKGLQNLKEQGYLDVENDADAGNMKYRVTLASLEERLATDMKAAAEAIQKSSVLTVHGSNDAVVPAEDGHAFAQSTRSGKKLVILEGANHRYTDHTSELSKAVLDFLLTDQE